jgi:hypothetical protein
MLINTSACSFFFVLMIPVLVAAGGDLFIVICCSRVLEVDQFSFKQEGRVKAAKKALC